MKIAKIVVGKGSSVESGDQKAWVRKYFEVEVLIENEEELENAKSKALNLINQWLQEKEQKPKPIDAVWVQSKNPCILYTKVGESIEADVLVKNLEGKNEYKDGENRYWLSKDGKLIFKPIPRYRAKNRS